MHVGIVVAVASTVAGGDASVGGDASHSFVAKVTLIGFHACCTTVGALHPVPLHYGEARDAAWFVDLVTMLAT